jgi:hypothetical protein
VQLSVLHGHQHRTDTPSGNFRDSKAALSVIFKQVYSGMPLTHMWHGQDLLPDRVPQALVIPLACFQSKVLIKPINIPSPLTSSTSIIN